MSSQKLKAAAEEIKAIIRKHDIAALVALHTPNLDGIHGTPGQSEYIIEITPSYSAVKWNDDGTGITILGHRKHYEGDTKVRDQKLRDTINMLTMLSGSMGPMVIRVIDLCEQAEVVWDTEHTDSRHTPGHGLN